MAHFFKNAPQPLQNTIDLDDWVNRSEASLRLLESAELSLVLRTKLVQTWRFTLSKLKHLERKSRTNGNSGDLRELQQSVLPGMLRDQVETALIILRASGNGREALESWEQLWGDLLSQDQRNPN